MSDSSAELKCLPIDTYAELMTYVKNLPPWASLCKELTPHSEFKIRNMDIHKQSEIYLDEPQTFCHINSDAEDPPRTESIHLPKTLVCHDMANGYHDDRYLFYLNYEKRVYVKPKSARCYDRAARCDCEFFPILHIFPPFFFKSPISLWIESNVVHKK